MDARMSLILSQHSEYYLRDVSEDVNSTTLGLYSFRIFVDCAWTTQKVDQAGGFPSGRHPLLGAGQSNHKRPLAKDIANIGAKRKQTLIPIQQENLDLSQGILTRSKRRKLAWLIYTVDNKIRSWDACYMGY
jgi:hypothetical protein